MRVRSLQARALSTVLLSALWVAWVPAADAPMPAYCRQDAVIPSVAKLRGMYAKPTEHWPRPCVAAGVDWRELASLPRTPPSPTNNPTASAKVILGRRLFHDPRLSGSGQIACASCHDQDLGWADGRRVSFGHNRTPTRRHAPSVRYAAYAQSLFWDGRASSLEDQALAPIVHAQEMAFTREGLEARLLELDDYQEAARTVYGRDRLTAEDVTGALAAFQRSLATPRGRFQAFLSGKREALPDQSLHGLHLFRTKAGCMNCHHGPTLSDNRFHNLGLSFFGTRHQDLGRYDVTHDARDAGAFRTPSLLGVGETAPYMHAGHFRDLRTVLSMYRAGMPQPKPRGAQAQDPIFPMQSPLVSKLALSEEEIAALEAFLESL
jgi:cytochrome c peroxidase